jgi:L-ribulose-5-phosphate 3-epimerase
MSLGPVGINTYAYAWTTPATEAVRRLADLGYRSFELLIHPPHLPLDDVDSVARRQLAATLDEVGATHRLMNLPSLDHNLASPLPRIRAASQQMFRDTLDLASDLGVQWLVVVPGRMSPLAPPSGEQRRAWLREGIDALLPYAEARGVGLAIENVPMAAFPDAASLAGFVRDYGSRGIGACYDAANAHFIGEDPAEGLREVRPRLGLVHVSDTGRAVYRHDPVGRGDVPFAGVPPVLAEIGYRGRTVLEVISPDPDADIRDSAERLAALGYRWEPDHA